MKKVTLKLKDEKRPLPYGDYFLLENYNDLLAYTESVECQVAINEAMENKNIATLASMRGVSIAEAVSSTQELKFNEINKELSKGNLVFIHLVGGYFTISKEDYKEKYIQ